MHVYIYSSPTLLNYSIILALTAGYHICRNVNTPPQLEGFFSRLIFYITSSRNILVSLPLTIHSHEIGAKRAINKFFHSLVQPAAELINKLLHQLSLSLSFSTYLLKTSQL